MQINNNLENAQDKIKLAQRILASGYLDQEAIEAIDRALYQALDAIRQNQEVLV